MKSVPIRNIKKEPPAEFSGQFRIAKLEELIQGTDMQQKIHRHDFFLLILIIKGSGKHIIDFKPYEIHPLSLFFMRPGQVHELCLEKGTEGFLLEFSNDFIHSKHKKTRVLLRSIGRQDFYSFTHKSHQKITQYCESILEEAQAQTEEYQDVVRANLQLLIVEIYRHRNRKDIKNDTHQRYKQEQLDVFLELLETNITKSKRVVDYAKMMHLTPYQLNNITKSLLGKTCSGLITEQLILEARRLLMVTTNQINEIADLLGFEDTSYFIRFFKKSTGYSPAVFVENFK